MRCVAACPPAPCQVQGKSYRPGAAVPAAGNCQSWCVRRGPGACRLRGIRPPRPGARAPRGRPEPPVAGRGRPGVTGRGKQDGAGVGVGTAVATEGPRDTGQTPWGGVATGVGGGGLPERVGLPPGGLPRPPRTHRLPPAASVCTESGVQCTHDAEGEQPRAAVLGPGVSGPPRVPQAPDAPVTRAPQPASAPTTGGASARATSSTTRRTAPGPASPPAAGPTAPSRGRSAAAAPPAPPPAPPSPSPRRPPVRRARRAAPPALLSGPRPRPGRAPGVLPPPPRL